MIKYTIRLLIIAGIILLALHFFRFSIRQGELGVEFRDKARIENLRKITSEVKEKFLTRLIGIWTVRNKGAKGKVPSGRVEKGSKSTDEQISEEDRRELEKIIEKNIR